MSQDTSDISEEADEVLAALAAAAGGEGNISARHDISNLLVSDGPDVLWTPKGGGKEAVAYSVIAKMNTSTRLSKSIRNNGNLDFQLNSRTENIIGHEPGTLRGVKDAGYKKYSHAESGADYVFSEGYSSISHRDPAWINHPDEGPEEPRREMSAIYISHPIITASAQQLPPGYQQPNANPTGSLRPLSPGLAGPSGPQTFSPLTPGQQQDKLDKLLKDVDKFLKKRKVQRRKGGSPHHSRHRGNARGQANVCRVLNGSSAANFDQISPRLMTDIMQRYNLTSQQAAGFAGNLGYESTGFTAGQEGNPTSGPGGIGYGQWTGLGKKGRRRAFLAFVKKRTGHEATAADALNYDLNRDFIFQELDSDHFTGMINRIKRVNTGNSQVDVAESSRIVWGQYETPQDFLDGTATSLPDRQCLSQRALQDYNQLGTTH